MQFRQRIRDNGKQRQAGKQLPRTYDFKIIAKDGTEKWVSLTGSQFQFNGEPVGLISVIDITERMQSEIALRESEEKFRTAFEDAAIAMSMTALDGHLMRVNQTFCSLLGYSREELLNKTFKHVTVPEDIQESSDWINDAIEGKIRNFSFEKRYVKKTEHWFWLSSVQRY